MGSITTSLPFSIYSITGRNRGIVFIISKVKSQSPQRLRPFFSFATCFSLLLSLPTVQSFSFSRGVPNFLPGPKEVEMSVTEKSKKTAPPQIVKLDKALKLAEVWVNNMSKVEDNEPTETDKEGRPSRLGLGAKISRHSNVRPSNDPVERKLYSQLVAKKRKAAQIAEESKAARDSFEDDEDNADLDSRTSAFVKKAAVPLAPSILGNKKRK